MFSIAKNSHWLQTQAVKAVASVHPAIEHNLQKVAALKKAFYLCNLEGLPGDYMEFGMFEGTSFIGAFECHEKTKLPDTPARAFWGYDSFGGFKYFDDKDKHPFFKEGDFKSSYEKTKRRIDRHFRGRAKWTVTPGWVEDTIGGKTAPEIGAPQVAIAFIDVDLGEPTRVALDFLKPALQVGSIIVFDDYLAYRGSLEKGVAGAFKDFQERNPEFQFRRAFDYGYGGQGFVRSQ